MIRLTQVFEANEANIYEPQFCCNMPVSFSGKCLGECGKRLAKPKEEIAKEPDSKAETSKEGDSV